MNKPQAPVVLVMFGLLGAIGGFNSVQIITNVGVVSKVLDLAVKLIGGCIGAVLGVLVGAVIVGSIKGSRG